MTEAAFTIPAEEILSRFPEGSDSMMTHEEIDFLTAVEGAVIACGPDAPVLWENIPPTLQRYFH